MLDHSLTKRSRPLTLVRASLESTGNESSKLIQRKHPMKIYPIKPRFVAKKISSEELEDDKEDKTIPPKKKLHKISEDPSEENLTVHFEKTRALSLDSDSYKFELPTVKTSVFQSELYGSSNFHEYSRGPVYLNEKLVKHSVVGPHDMFERHPRKKYQQNSSVKHQDNDSSFTTYNESLTNISRRQNRQTTSILLESPMNRTQSRKAVEPKHKHVQQELKIPKDQVLAEIANMKARQNSFYQKIDYMALGMRRRDMLFFTKEQRCLESFEKTEDRWNKIFEKTNNKLGRSPLQSTVFRAEEHREKIEKAEELELLKTKNERLGINFWYSTLRRMPKNNESRGIIITNEFPAAFRSVIIDKPDSSVEIIRKPRRLNASLSRWASESLLSTSNISGSLRNRNTEEYIDNVSKKRSGSVNQYKPSAESMQDLILMGENVLDKEVEAVFHSNRLNDYYPVMLKKNKNVDSQNEVIARHYDKKFLYLNGYHIAAKVDLP